MWKFYLIVLSIVIFSGCSKVTFSPSMCEKIASDPNTLFIPQECRPYIEADAQKAFDKTDKKQSIDADTIKFGKE